MSPEILKNSTKANSSRLVAVRNYLTFETSSMKHSHFLDYFRYFARKVDDSIDRLHAD